MAGDYVTMQNRIADDLVNESITTAQIKNAILSSIANYESMEFYFNQKTSTFSTVLNQEYYSTTDLADIPNISYIRAMNVTTSGYKVQMNAVDFQDMDNQQSSSITGLPRAYAGFKQQLRLYPIPDAVYTISLAYVYRFAALSADADTNAWMTDGEELIRNAAKKRLALDIIYSDKIAARCEKLENEAYDSLRAENRQRILNQTLRMAAPLTAATFNIYQGY